jgi:hypothetical protein
VGFQFRTSGSWQRLVPIAAVAQAVDSGVLHWPALANAGLAPSTEALSSHLSACPLPARHPSHPPLQAVGGATCRKAAAPPSTPSCTAQVRGTSQCSMSMSRTLRCMRLAERFSFCV